MLSLQSFNHGLQFIHQTIVLGCCSQEYYKYSAEYKYKSILFLELKLQLITTSLSMFLILTIVFKSMLTASKP